MRAVVVGASSGLGRCIGIGLAQRGARVALLARRKERLERAAQEAGAGALAVECDVTDAASCHSAIDAAADGLGGIDAVVYAAGIGPLARLVDLDAETWRRTFDTNVIGAALLTAAAVPHLAASAGRAVYLSSVSASQTAFASGWNSALAAELVPKWLQRGLMTGVLLDVNELVGVVDAVLRAGATASLPSVVVAPRPRPAGA